MKKKIAVLVVCVMFHLPASAQRDDVGGASGGGNPLVSLDPNAIIVGSGFDGTDPIMDGRLNRDGVASVCAPPKVFPGDFAVGTNFSYRVFGPYYNGADTCITVNFDPNPTMVSPPDCGTNAHAIAYLNSFDPTNRSANYLGDVGSSSTQSFSFAAPADSSILIVVQDNGQMGANPTCNFDFASNELGLIAAPTAPPLALVALALFLLASGIYLLRRRQGTLSA